MSPVVCPRCLDRDCKVAFWEFVTASADEWNKRTVSFKDAINELNIAYSMCEIRALFANRSE